MPACPTCGTENSQDARACVNCGVPLEVQSGEGPKAVYCASCGSENSLQASFCGRCGIALRSPLTGSGYHVESPRPAAHAPRDLGELISETFRVYRERFWLFFMIALAPQIPFLIVEIIGAAPLPLILNLAVSIIGILSAIVLTVLAIPAMMNAVARGTSFVESYRDAGNRFWTLLLAWIVFSLTLMLCVALMLIIVGIPLFFYVLVSWYFYPWAVMLEGKGPLGSLERSKELVAGSRWRLLGVGVVFVVMGFVLIVALFIPVAIILAFSPTAANVAAIGATAAVMPIAYIGATLVYFEIKERWDRQTPAM